MFLCFTIFELSFTLCLCVVEAQLTVHAYCCESKTNYFNLFSCIFSPNENYENYTNDDAKIIMYL